MMYENFRHTHGSGSGAGPVEGARQAKRVVTPVSKNHHDRNGNLDSTAPSKSERLNSPNTASWEPDVRMLLSTSQWLKIHGLKRHKLDMGQILPSIGFRHSDDYVRPLKKPVRARYCKGLFTQVPFRDGSVYNLVASKEKLRMIESQLKQAISLYKRRLEWLTTESRRVFGVIEERCICIVLDMNTTSESEFSTYLHGLVQLLKEQVMFIAKFNLIRCAMDSDCWQEHAVNVTLDSMEGALNWLWDLKTTVPRSATCTVEGILKGLADQHIEAVYLFTEGSASNGSQEMLKRKIQGSRVPIHVVSFNCNDPGTVTFLKDISRITKGRFHAYSVINEYEDSFDSFTKSIEADSTKQPQGRGRGDGMPSLKLGVGVREDVITLWEELDEARNTLAEIQALLCEIKDPKETPVSTSPNTAPDKTQDRITSLGHTKAKSEMYMSSRDWLKRHGLKSKKLLFYDLLQSLAFKHCDGVVDIQTAPVSLDSTDAIVRPKLVNARYCDKFAHVRWKDGSIMHVHVSGPIHRNYEQRILSALDSYRKRMEWLQQGSRELFGTIIEDQVAVLIDTSASMASRLFLVKDKLYRLMQEQLRHKLKFNLMKYDTRVQAWRDRLVDCNTHNLDNAWQWVKGLSTGGSTNTLAALKLALADPQCHAIYLLTDGRPDQPPSSILAQVQLLNPVPIHAISFNCADTEANQFLCQLAAETGGRFHYFSEDGYDTDGPRPFESEDLRLLREEIEKGLGDLRKVTLIRNECAQLDWFGSNTGRCSKSHPRSVSASSHRPFSAKHTMTPSPPGSERSASARIRPASARPRPASARPRPASARITYSSHKDYLVNTACRDIPRSPSQSSVSRKVGETKTSQLRLGLRKKTADSWMLEESRQYLGRKPEDFKQPKRKIKKKKNGSNGDENDEELKEKSSRWLKKHGLVARRLTILDALAPTLIPHSTKYVPILDKHVLSKVFDQVLPLAHTSGSNRDEVQLVNPQGVNLKAYEARLEKAIEDYKRRLDEKVFVNLSDEERMKYPEDRIPSFLDNKQSILDDLERQGWPLDPEDITLLEREIEQAQTYLLQSKDLRQKSEQASREIAEQQRKAREEAENKRIEQIMSKPAKTSPPPSQSYSNKNRLLNHKVLARSEVDGFYYAGVVTRCLNPRYVEVDFRDFDRQVVSSRYVITVQGARPCPSLKVGDYVLVKTLVPREEEDDEINDGVQCYVPGIVQVVPLRKAPATKCYTILRYNGKKITSLRNDLVKISKARYTFACRYIRDALLTAYRSTTPFAMYLRDGEDDAGVEDKNKESGEESPRSQASSRKSSRSGRSSRASSRGSSRKDGSRSRSPSPGGSAEGSPPPSSKEATPRRSSGDRKPFEELKQELEEEHKRQLAEVERKMEDLQKQLERERERREKAAEELNEKRRELDDEQRKLLQQQIDDQNNRQKEIQEEQKRLQNQQNDLLKKQKDQQEQLLMQQFNQTQQLQLQQQQLLQQLANNLPSETRSERPRVKLPDIPPVSPPRSRSISPPSPSSAHSSPRSTPRGSTKESGKASSKGSRSRSSGKKSTKSSSPRSPVASPRPQSSTRSSSHSLPPGTEDDRDEDKEESKEGDKKSNSSEKRKSSSSSSSLSSSLSSSSSPPVSDDEQEAEPAPLPAGSESEPPSVQIHVSNGNEACLMTKGSHGLLISRLPPDEDPAVETGRVRRPVQVGEEVLARWSDEGWYYRGTIRQDCGDGSYYVEDSVGDLEQIYRPDIILEADDADNEIDVHDPVVALHPSFPYSYAPGTVLQKDEYGLCVRHYDGIESVVPREDTYLLTPEKFESVCRYILQCEESLVDQAVVARNDQDGMFHLGTVRERVGNGRQYIIEWADQTVQLQSSGYIFGAHTKRRPLNVGDRVLALSDPALFVYLPGWIAGTNGRRLVIKFCNGKSSSHVDPQQCFWLSRDYYDRMVENFKKKSKENER